MMSNFFGRVDIDKKNVYLPDGNAEDLREACRKYEQQIKDAGGIDLQVLGIGGNGHIGFNEPAGSFASRTWVKFSVNKQFMIIRCILISRKKSPVMLSPWVLPQLWNPVIVCYLQMVLKRPMPFEK